MFGKLDIDQIYHGVVQLGAQLTMVFGIIAVIALLTYTKKWTWLYKNYLTSLDHKKIGIMYILVATVMGLRGLSEVLLMRLQQSVASGNQGIMTSDHYQQIFTAHGTIMIFFVAMGLMFGLINLIMPLQIGARDVAFPFMNAVSFWLFFAGAMLMNVSLLIGEMGATGWLAYPPLSQLEYSPGVGVDYWIWALQISGIGSLLSGVNFITTIIKMRAEGMTFMKMPMFTWSVLGSMILVIASFPILTVTLSLLALDRTVGTHFFTSDMGGNAMMYINMIWAWGHPEVYILILPAFGIFSEIVASACKKRLFGYTSMVVAIMAITILSFVVWLHHFFTMGAGANVNAFFGIMTMIIAIPTGVKVFNWLFTMYKGRISFTVPMLWFMGFIGTFTLGGVTGVILSVPPADFQLHNSLFLVAHFHNMVIGGVVFGYLAGINYWFPKIFGFQLEEKLGKLVAYLWIIGFFVAFVPIYILGLMGATRRLDHYDPSLGWQWLFIIAGIGSLIIAAAIGLNVLQVLYSLKNRKLLKVRSNDSWGSGRSLEWAVPSPIPEYNFKQKPVILSRDPVWEHKHGRGGFIWAPQDKIMLPKNTAYPVLIGGLIFCIGFGIIWHIWWLASVCFVATILTIIKRTMDDDTEYEYALKVGS